MPLRLDVKVLSAMKLWEVFDHFWVQKPQIPLSIGVGRMSFKNKRPKSPVALLKQKQIDLRIEGGNDMN